MSDTRKVVSSAGRFGLVGAACAGLNVGIVWLGHHQLGWPYLWAAATTCLVTIPLSYLAHREFSFGPELRATERSASGRFRRFLVQQLTQFALGLLLLVLFVETAGLPPATAMAAVAVLMFVFGYVSNAAWVFRVFGPR